MKKLLTIVFVVITASFAKAQFAYERYFSVAYDANIPLTNHDYVSGASFKGFQLGYRERINDNFYAGLQLNNSTYNQHDPRQTYFSADGTALTAELFKYVYSYGATLSGEYHFSPEKRFTPFAGLGVGANYYAYAMYYNIYSSAESKWGVLIRPEVGAIMKLGALRSWGIIGAVHYDYSSSKSENFGYSNFNNVGLRLGVVFMNW